MNEERIIVLNFIKKWLTLSETSQKGIWIVYEGLKGVEFNEVILLIILLRISILQFFDVKTLNN